MSERSWPVRISALGSTVAATAVWRSQGQLNVTVVAKATFALVPGSAMSPAPPEPIVSAEQHHGDDPARSVRTPSDLAFYRRVADVTLSGHACAPRGRAVSTQAVRLAVYRGQAVLDKTLHVIGDRKDGRPQPFEHIPLVYERAIGSPDADTNPVGVPAALANVVDPGAPDRAAGFGPIAQAWPVRRTLLGELDPRVLDQPIADLPPAFEWSYFQQAPEEQQVPYLSGDEWVVLDGVRPDIPRLKSHLPEARGEARVHGLTPGSAHPLELHADALHIDADALRCTVTWRGIVSVPDEAALGALSVVARVTLNNVPIAWPDAPEPPARDQEQEGPLFGTIDDDGTPSTHPVLPFASGPAALPPPSSHAPRRSTLLDDTLTSDGAMPAAHAVLPFAHRAPAPAPEGARPTLETIDEMTVAAFEDASGRPALPFLPGSGAASLPLPPVRPVPRGEESLTGTLSGDDVPPRRLATLPFVRNELAAVPPPTPPSAAPRRAAPPPPDLPPLPEPPPPPASPWTPPPETAVAAPPLPEPAAPAAAAPPLPEPPAPAASPWAPPSEPPPAPPPPRPKPAPVARPSTAQFMKGIRGRIDKG